MKESRKWLLLNWAALLAYFLGAPIYVTLPIQYTALLMQIIS